jgi:hypothetical protein
VCKCFGYFEFQKWDAVLPANIEVRIIYREKIRVFFDNAQEAKDWNYTDYDTGRKADGFIYAFTGLRGDAKQLWRKVQLGEEPRLKLVQAATV